MGEEVEDKAAMNTDRELYREPTDRVGHEFYQPSIHVTESGAIGINVGGSVWVRPLREWHAAMTELESLRAYLTRVEEERDDKVARWLLAEAATQHALAASYAERGSYGAAGLAQNRAYDAEHLAKVYREQRCLSRATSAEGK